MHNRFAHLDGLRAIAILLVVAFHAWFFLQFAMVGKHEFLAFSDALPRVAGFIRRGDIGVDIFFVLSGFLLCWQLFSERKSQGSVNIKSFYLKRFFRIYPLYIIALTLVSLGTGPSLALLGNLFAYNIWFNPFDVIIPWTWSLSVELEFYAIVPILILLARNGWAVLALVLGFAALSIGWSIWTLISHPQLVENSLIELEIAERRADQVLYYRLLYVAMPVRLSQFVMGLGAAWLIVHRPFSPPSRMMLLVGIITVICGLCLPLLYNPFGEMSVENQSLAFFEMSFGRVAFAFAVALLIAMMQAKWLPRLTAVLASKIWEPIARFSFSMYLFHPVFVYVGIVVFIGSTPVTSVSFGQFLGVFAVAVLGSMLMGIGTWYGVERPAIRFGQRVIGRAAAKGR